MNRRATVGMVAVILLILSMAVVANAQEDTGTISGTVFRDLNENGICSGENETGVPAIPLQLIYPNDNTIINLASGNGGQYRLSSASMGTWQVTVNPGAGWKVTSQQTRQVLVEEDEPDVEDIDFCIVQVTTVTPTISPALTPTATTTPPVLPESGAPLSPVLMLATGLGLLFLAAGAALYVHARNTN